MKSSLYASVERCLGWMRCFRLECEPVTLLRASPWSVMDPERKGDSMRCTLRDVEGVHESNE